jgi:hypothetical protein
MTLGTNSTAKEIAKLPDSRKVVNDTFSDSISTSKDAITIMNRESTEKGSPITKTFKLNYENITQAVLKVNLLADEGKILGFIPNEFKIQDININGKVFQPSDPRSSVNVIERLGDGSLNKILNKNGENNVSVNFNAPVGAGISSPHAEISAILIVHGKKGVFDPTSFISPTQNVKDAQAFIKDNVPLTIGLAVLLVVVLVAIAFIVSKAPPKDINNLIKTGQGVKNSI